MYIIYGKNNCPYCYKAKNLLELKGLEFDYLTLDEDYTKEQLVALCPFPPKTLPQIFKVINDEANQYIGGFVELEAKLALDK